jgi:hypothetical protein
MAGIRKIPFNALPEGVRQRFVSATQGVEDPMPILEQKTNTSLAMFGWAVVGILGLALVGGLSWWGFGETHDSTAIQGFAYVPIYILGFGLIIWSVLRMIRVAVTSKSLPYHPGRYVFPIDIVDATSDVLRLIPMNSMVDFKGVNHHRNGVYTHTEMTFIFDDGVRESFTLHNQMMAQQVLDDMAIQERRVVEAAQNNDIEALLNLDVFLEARMSDAWNDLEDFKGKAPDEGPAARKLPALFKVALPIAAVLGIMLATPTQLVRNFLSDTAMYQELKTTQSTWKCESYLRNGWLHKDEVRTVFLPTAAFRSAKSRGTVEHMRAFLKEYPNSAHEEAGREVIHNLYVEALGSFKAAASTEDPTVVPFMEHLLVYLEEHDSPDVKVRFLPPTMEALNEVDLILAGGGENNEEYAKIAPHFVDATNVNRESTIVTVLQEGFGKVFSNDVLQLTGGPRLALTDFDKTVEEPTMLVSYGVGPSGFVYESTTSTKLFVGIVVVFDVYFRMPGNDQGIFFSLEVEPPEHFTVQSYGLNSAWNDLAMDSGGPSEGQVYNVMAIRAFDQLATKTSSVFFKEPFKSDPAPSKSFMPSIPDYGEITPEDIERLLKELEAGL